MFDNAQKISHGSYLILYRANSLNNPRLGLIVAKKNIKHANQRNQFKRIIRESFRINQHNLPNVDIIVLARKGALEEETQQLRTKIDQSWQRLIKYHDK